MSLEYPKAHFVWSRPIYLYVFQRRNTSPLSCTKAYCCFCLFLSWVRILGSHSLLTAAAPTATRPHGRAHTKRQESDRTRRSGGGEGEGTKDAVLSSPTSISSNGRRLTSNPLPSSLVLPPLSVLGFLSCLRF